MTVEEEWCHEVGEEAAGASHSVLPIILSRQAVREILRDAPAPFGLAFRVLYASAIQEDELLRLTSADRLDHGRVRVGGRVVCVDEETALALGELEGVLFPFTSQQLRSALRDAAPAQASRFQSLGGR